MRKNRGEVVDRVDDPHTVLDKDDSTSVTPDITADPSRRLEVAAGVVAVVLMGVYLILVLQIDLRRESAPGQIDARSWPTALGILGLVIGVWRLLVAITRPPSERDDLERQQAGGIRRLVLTLVLVAVYLFLWQLRAVVAFGYSYNLFVFITPLLLFGLLWLYGARSWKALIFYPVISTAFIYVLFGMLLRIPL